jgi:alkane 1-monooxygenase
MNTMKWYAYLMPILFYVTSFYAFQAEGIGAYATLILAFGVIATLELILKPINENSDDEESLKKNPLYRWIQIGFVFLQWITLLYFLYITKHQDVDTATSIGRIICMGLLCGVFGINVAHELGHHVNKTDQILAKASLLTSMYMHFFIEHNKGHHKHVSTAHDPASARYNEWIYVFYIRSIVGSYLSAWQIENKDTRNQFGTWLTLSNQMIQLHIVEISFLIILYLYGGLLVVGSFLAAALLGILLLESVNYIQHYGLTRKATSATSFERTQVYHSWDCHYPLGRMMLFELSRHSDHHYLASRPYQLLRHHAQAPLLPAGYPGSILLALIPPLWCSIMNRKIAKMKDGIDS